MKSKNGTSGGPRSLVHGAISKKYFIVRLKLYFNKSLGRKYPVLGKITFMQETGLCCTIGEGPLSEAEIL